jgi:hypothetical protein
MGILALMPARAGIVWLTTVAQELLGQFGALPAERLFPIGAKRCASIENKKADVVQHPKAFCHVGLLFNLPPGRAGLFFA